MNRRPRLNRFVYGEGALSRLSISAFLLFCSTVGGVILPVANAQDSLAEAARKNRPKDVQVTAKRTWTNDDIQPTSQTASFSSAITETKESDSETLRKFRNLDKETLGAAVLKSGDAPNVEFPNRRDWEQRLFEAKQAWLDQVDRMVGHKDSSKYSQEEENRLALGAKRIFERISSEGVTQARAVNDPILKAHLEL